jgi:hypothetical protein
MHTNIIQAINLFCLGELPGHRHYSLEAIDIKISRFSVMNVFVFAVSKNNYLRSSAAVE